MLGHVEICLDSHETATISFSVSILDIYETKYLKNDTSKLELEGKHNQFNSQNDYIEIKKQKEVLFLKTVLVILLMVRKVIQNVRVKSMGIETFTSASF